MVLPFCTSQVGNPALEYKNKTSSNSRNPSFPLQTSCHLLPNSKYASENTDCLHGLIVFMTSEGLVFHSASTFKQLIHSFLNAAQFLRLQKQFCILKCRHVLPRGISHQLIPKPKHFMISLKP